MNFTAEERNEISRVLALARNAGPWHPASGAPREVPVLGAIGQPCGCDETPDSAPRLTRVRPDTGGTVEDNGWIKNLDDFHLGASAATVPDTP